jgi:translation initiation factor RLI1
MPDKFAVVNYNKCRAKKCNNGVCEASGVCEKKVIKQENPYEPPFINMGSCNGCNKCVSACPFNAIEKGK